MSNQEDRRRIIAERLDHLFATLKAPNGDPYTMREVADAINAEAGEKLISVQYLSQLRLRQRQIPSYEKLAAIARYFGVDVAYFSDDLTAEQVDDQVEVVRALRDAEVRDVALRVTGMSEQALAHVKQLIESVRQMDGLPPTEEP